MAAAEACGMSDLTVVRLLQNPLGQEAPVGHRGDMVRVSDGRASIYLFPWEFEAAEEALQHREHREHRGFAGSTALSCAPPLLPS